MFKYRILFNILHQGKERVITPLVVHTLGVITGVGLSLINYGQPDFSIAFSRMIYNSIA